MGRVVVTSDLHFTINPRDEYRWKIFPQLLSLNPDAVFILGDLTDAKDAHRAKLVNRIVESIADLSEKGIVIRILQGNHDYLESGHPFFRFLSRCRGDVKFITETTPDFLWGHRFLFVPHAHDLRDELKSPDWSDHHYVLMHQTVNGSIASNGQAMESALPSRFTKAGPKRAIFSGDIHVPQKIGEVTYVGSPYHVHFGDRFTPRVIVIDGSSETSVPLANISRMTIELNEATPIAKLNLKRGDQVKLRVKLHHADVNRWLDIKKEIEEECVNAGVILCGLELLPIERKQISIASEAELPRMHHTPESALRRFAEIEKISEDLLELGLELIR